MRNIVPGIVLVALASACSGRKTPDGVGRSSARWLHTAQADSSAPLTFGTRIGSACVEQDGWVPQKLVPSPLPVAQTTVGTKVQATRVPAGYVDYPQAPAGRVYCQIPDVYLYPFGYLTSNCAANADCPAGAACDGRLCRLPCASDSDCRAPTRCGSARGLMKVRHCQYYDNPILSEREHDERE
jgi:hypothetical protein